MKTTSSSLLLLLLGSLTAAVSAQLTLGNLENRQHDVTGTVVALSDRLLEFRDFRFDGNAPAAFFYASTDDPPRSGGLILPTPQTNCNPSSPLGGADGTVTWRAEFPPGTSLADYAGGSISVWCDAFSANFGEVSVPTDLATVPRVAQGPGLECFALPVVPAIALVPEGYQCEPLSEDFQVRWQVDGVNLHVELVGRIAEINYMGFGLSGSLTATRMVGADPVVVDMAEGTARAQDFYLSAQAQCSGTTGVCPDSGTSANATNDITAVSGEREFGVTLIRYTKPLVPSQVDEQVGDTPIDRRFEPGTPTFVVWAIGPMNIERDLPLFHDVDYPRTDVTIDFGRALADNCEPLLEAIDPTVERTFSPTEAPVDDSFFIPLIRETTSMAARIGPSALDRGVAGITGLPAWGIAWYMNGTYTGSRKGQYKQGKRRHACDSLASLLARSRTDLLIPMIEMRRGTTYTFLVNGGDDPAATEVYHPLYLTNNTRGGFANLSPDVRATEEIYAGIEVTGNDASGGITSFEPTAVGPLCQYTNTDETNPALDADGDFFGFFGTLDRQCASVADIVSQAGVLEFTPDESTPDEMFYHCVTHSGLGWKIRVIDANAPSILDVSCENLRNNPVELAGGDITLNTVLDPFGGTLTVEMTYDGIGWLAMGFTDGSNTMPGTEAVIGLPDAGSVLKYNLNARARSGVVPMEDARQTLINATVVQENGQTILSFVRLLREEGEHPVALQGENTFLWAYGRSNTLATHRNRGAFVLEPSQCFQFLDGKNITPGAFSTVEAGDDSGPNKNLWIAHGICASIAWALLVPAAIASSVLRSYLPDGAWFQVHRGLNSLAITLTLISFLLAVKGISDNGGSHFSDLTHHTVGLIIFLATLAQGVNGLLRPHVPHPEPADEEDVDEDKGAPPKTSARVAWEYGHRILGVVLLAVAWWQVQSGIELYSDIFVATDRRPLFWAVVLVLSFIYIAAGVFQKVKLLNNY